MALIGIGPFSKYYYYIFLVFICQFICDFFTGFNKDLDDLNKNLRNVENILNLNFILKDHYLIQNLLEFLGHIACSFIFYLAFRIFEKSENDKWTPRKLSEFERNYFNRKPENIFSLLVLIGFSYSLGTILRTFLASLRFDASFWNIEIVIIIFFSYKILNNKISNHQYVSIVLLGLFLSILQLIYMFSPRTKHSDCNTTEECKEKYLYDNDIFEIIIIKYGKYYIALIFLLYILSYILKDYSWVKSKYLMDNKCIKIYKILLCFGIIGSLLVIIILIFTSNIPCSTFKNINYNNNNNTYFYINNENNTIFIDFNKQVCSLVDYNEDQKELNIYYDNIFIFFKELRNKIDSEDNSFLRMYEIFIYFIFFFMKILIIFSQTIMLKFIDAIILLVNNNFNYFFERLFFFILNRGNENYLRTDVFFLVEIEEIISICGYLIYMEILELKFWGLDHDLKRSISLRASNEYDIDRIIGEEEEEEENDDKEEMVEAKEIN